MAPRTGGEETREAILRAAEESFARFGYDATGVAEICRRAGVTKGAFYHHFPSKQAVFLELLDRWLNRLDEQFARIRAEARTVPEGLLRMVGMLQQVFQEGSGRLPMFLEYWNKAAHDPAIWQATIAPYRRYRAFFAGLVEAGIAEGTIRSVDPQMVAGILVSLAVGVVMQGMMDPHGADWQGVAYEGMQILLEGLRDRSEEEEK